MTTTINARGKMFYKILSSDGRAILANHEQYSLPRQIANWNGTVSFDSGLWHTVQGRLKPCINGLHLVRTPRQVFAHMNDGRRVFVAEAAGTVIKCEHKYVARSVRLVREVLRGTPEWQKLFAGTRYEGL